MSPQETIALINYHAGALANACALFHSADNYGAPPAVRNMARAQIEASMTRIADLYPSIKKKEAEPQQAAA